MATKTERVLARVQGQVDKIMAAAESLEAGQARFLVDNYYAVQDVRIACAAQERSTEASVPILAYTGKLMAMVEDGIRDLLHEYAKGHRAGRWALSICGIGPVITAGLLAHIDITRCQTAGAVWRFAGLDPSKKWIGRDGAKALVKETLARASGKVSVEDVAALALRTDNRLETVLAWMTPPAQTEPKLDAEHLAAALARRPWNARLKVLCAFKIGESFVKTQNSADDTYGKVYAQRKAEEVARNEAGGNAELAARILTEKSYRGETTAKKMLESGKLPQAQIHARARRYAVKLFLAHYFEVAYECYHGQKPPKPYILTQPGHVHFVSVPCWPVP